MIYVFLEVGEKKEQQNICPDFSDIQQAVKEQYMRREIAGDKRYKNGAKNVLTGVVALLRMCCFTE